MWLGSGTLGPVITPTPPTLFLHPVCTPTGTLDTRPPQHKPPHLVRPGIDQDVLLAALPLVEHHEREDALLHAQLRSHGEALLLQEIAHHLARLDGRQRLGHAPRTALQRRQQRLSTAGACASRPQVPPRGRGGSEGWSGSVSYHQRKIKAWVPQRRTCCAPLTTNCVGCLSRTHSAATPARTMVAVSTSWRRARCAAWLGFSTAMSLL